jgi:hypothetical protein
VLGHPEAVVDRRVAGGRVQPRGCTDLLGGHTGDGLGRLGAVLRLGDELLPLGERVRLAPLLDEGPVDQPLSGHHVSEGVDDGDVRARLELKVVSRLHVGAAYQVDPPWVDDDQRRALAQALLHPRGEDRVPVGGVGSDQQDDVRPLDRLEVLRAGRRAEGLPQPVAGRGVAHPRTGVHVVVAERRPDHLLHHEDLLVGAARRGDPADRQDAVLSLYGGQPHRRVADRLLPGHHAPRVGDPLAHHR